VEPLNEAELLNQYGPFLALARFDAATTKGQVFTVLATQNPIEQEGVYPLSKAFEDRFMFKLLVHYPSAEELHEIERHAFRPDRIPIQTTAQDHVKTLYFIAALRSLLFGLEAERWWGSAENRSLRERVHTLINFTHVRPFGGRSSRDAALLDGADRKQDELRGIKKEWERSEDSKLSRRAALLTELLSRDDFAYPEVASGSSPRGLLKWIRAAHVMAFLNRNFEGGHVRPTWNDFQTLAHDVLRHRIRLTPGYEAMGAKSETVIDLLLEWINQW
jgi:MoxR-like ATPase